jgi:predicted amidohydrolase YtcJ
MLCEQSERTPPGQWVRVVGGWSGAQFAERRLPTVSELNAAAPGTPVLVLHLYQSAILNRAAVAALGYTKDTRDPAGGQIVRDHAGEALTLSSVDFENFCEPRPEMPGTATHEVEQAVRILVGNNWGFRLHATYGETIDRFLGIFDKLAAEGLLPNGNRWFFDHAETVSPRALERISALGGGVSVQSRTMFQSQPFIDRYGRAVAGHSPPIRAMLDAGLTVAAGSNATRAASYNPWLSLSWLVTGRDIAGHQFRTGPNLVDRATALAMYTRAGAQLSGEAGVKGTLSLGKYADFAVLSADYLEVDDADISRIESVLTVVGGRVVWSSADFEAIAAPLPSPIPDWSPVTKFGGVHRESMPL